MNPLKIRVCVYTSTRAEYGLMRRLIKEIDSSGVLELRLLVSGTHLAAAHGMTLDEITKDGVEPDACVDIEPCDDSPQGICRSMGMAMARYGRYFGQSRPDVLVVLGDRWEAFCCAASAHVHGIPIAHIHGGETTSGAIDEAFRHSITKMALYHFPCCDAYRKRIIQMGEAPERVFDVGALGVENIQGMRFMEKAELERSLGLDLDTPFFLITYHPETLGRDGPAASFSALLGVLDQFRDHRFIFTGANADAGGQKINALQNEFQRRHKGQCLIVSSLGSLRYLSAMKLCRAVVGNSSSGIIEAPALGVPTINIGDRQKGRVRALSVIDCTADHRAIFDAFKKLDRTGFQADIKAMEIPFKKEGTAKMIRQILETADFAENTKIFYDIKA
ncbi:MAG: UDP-N-acetylglucosamine 2-epimerase (hydrolyzing) [Desulfobacter sp.]|nr:MAG: UDP-N-acetylglucosamine 2-epimerase (hydrolyzing) [Desulfobacter sp.]